MLCRSLTLFDCNRFRTRIPGGSEVGSSFLYDITLNGSCTGLISLEIAARLHAFQPDQAMERRRHPRTELNEPAYVSSGGSVMGCVVRNVSTEGAAIDVDNAAFVPARFRLVMAGDRSVRDCRVVWIQDNRIGVTFLS